MKYCRKNPRPLLNSILLPNFGHKISGINENVSTLYCAVLKTLFSKDKLHYLFYHGSLANPGPNYSSSAKLARRSIKIIFLSLFDLQKTCFHVSNIQGQSASSQDLTASLWSLFTVFHQIFSGCSLKLYSVSLKYFNDCYSSVVRSEKIQRLLLSFAVLKVIFFSAFFLFVCLFRTYKTIW